MALSVIKAGFFSYSNLVIGGGLSAGLWLEILPLGIMFAISLVMILCPLGIAKGLLSADLEGVEDEHFSSKKIEYLASSLFGLYFLACAIVDAFYVWGIFLAIRHMGMPWVWTPEYSGAAMAGVAEFCVALWFLFGAKGLWAMVGWARKISTQK